METPSQGKNKYFLTFTDDFSRYTTVYLLKNKHEVIKYFKIYKNEVENQKNKRIQVLRTDNGLEFLNNEMKNVLANSGIIFQRSCVYTQEQNGLFKKPFKLQTT